MNLILRVLIDSSFVVKGVLDDAKVEIAKPTSVKAAGLSAALGNSGALIERQVGENAEARAPEEKSAGIAVVSAISKGTIVDPPVDPVGLTDASALKDAQGGAEEEKAPEAKAASEAKKPEDPPKPANDTPKRPEGKGQGTGKGNGRWGPKK